MEDYQKECKKLINRFLLLSKKFCHIACVPDGLYDILSLFSQIGVVEDEFKYSPKLSYDFDYFAFVKSTKSLFAIRHLLNSKEYVFSEDCFMIIRSIFENHILSRYIRDNIDDENRSKEIVDSFILAPLGVSFDFYISRGWSGVFSKGNAKVGDNKNIKSVIMGSEIDYYNYFYPFLCQYTHCSYGAISCYFGTYEFTLECDKFSLLTHLLAIFVFTKIYEGVVTVNGEDLEDNRLMKSFYNLAYDSLELQIKIFEYLIEYYKEKPKERVDYILEKYLGESNVNEANLKISKMLEKMKESLFDKEIGSLNKSVFANGSFIRKYQEW